MANILNLTAGGRYLLACTSRNKLLDEDHSEMFGHKSATMCRLASLIPRGHHFKASFCQDMYICLKRFLWEQWNLFEVFDMKMCKERRRKQRSQNQESNLRQLSVVWGLHSTSTPCSTPRCTPHQCKA